MSRRGHARVSSPGTSDVKGRGPAQGSAARPAPGLNKPALDAAAVVLLAQSAEDVFNRCVALALQVTRGTTALIMLLRPDEDLLEVVAAAGGRAEVALGRTLRRGEALGWRVVTSGQPLLIEQAHTCADAHFLAGRPHPGMYLGVPLLDPDGRVLGVLSTDTTDSPEQLGEGDARALLLLGQAAGVASSRLEAVERAQRSAWQFERLATLSHELEALSQPEEIARLGLRTLIELSGLSSGAVFEVDSQGLARLTVAEGVPLTDRSAAERLRAPHAPQGLVAEVVRRGRSLAVPDYTRWRGAEQPATAVRSAAATALRLRGEVVGVIGLAHLFAPRPVPPNLVTLLEMVAARIGQALERAAGLEHLRHTREAALRAVGRVLEGRDGETFGHTDRVTALALRLGGALGLDEQQLQHLRWGAYLHDIGKVAVSDDVLRKPGPLDAQERALMQRHVVVGDDMLRDEAFAPREVRRVVRHHHERWDGAGYPDGLAGEAIPLLARIFSVVDVYDALLSERPYKRAWSPAEALAELRRCAGHQFDPSIVAAFETVMRNPSPGAGPP